MNPWWLRPPAEEEAPAAEKRARTAKPEQPKEPEKPKKTQPQGRTGPDRDQTPRPEEKAERSRRSSRRRSSGRRRKAAGKTQKQIAVFCDAESLALALRSANLEDLELERMVAQLGEMGRLVLKRAYGDWQRLQELASQFRGAGLELVGGPAPGRERSYRSGIQLIVDAMELGYSPSSPEVFVLISAEADLLPLVEKLRNAGRRVVGVGFEEFLAPAQLEVYDEFIDLTEIASGGDEEEEQPPEIDGARASLFSELEGILDTLGREKEGLVWGAELKREMRRRRPDLIAGSFGYTTFSEFLEDADRHEVIHLERDDRSGSYYVTVGGRQ